MREVPFWRRVRLAALCLVFAALACGVKGPPRPPLPEAADGSARTAQDAGDGASSP